MKRVVLVVSVLMACGSSSNDATPGSGAGSGSGSGGAAAAGSGSAKGSASAAKPPAKPASLEDLPKSDLPPIDLALPPMKKLAESKKLNNEGYKLHVAKDYDGALAKYRAAVAADPGNLLARYNVASILVDQKQTLPALALLAEIKAAGCRTCLGIVIHARTDSEWAGVVDDPHFKLISDGVEVKNPDPAAVAKEIEAESIEDGEEPTAAKKKRKLSAEVASLIHPRLGVRAGGNRFYKVEQLEAWLKKPDKGYLSTFQGCKDESNHRHCCSFELGQAEDNDYIVGFCLAEAPGGVYYLDNFQFERSI